MNKIELLSMVRKSRQDHEQLFDGLPTKAVTSGQKKLKRKHGSPHAFAKACANCIGEISPLEATIAISDYLKEWNQSL